MKIEYRRSFVKDRRVLDQETPMMVRTRAESGAKTHRTPKRGTREMFGRRSLLWSAPRLRGAFCTLAMAR
jgi:hypothetical protein